MSSYVFHEALKESARRRRARSKLKYLVWAVTLVTLVGIFHFALQDDWSNFAWYLLFSMIYGVVKGVVDSVR